MDVKDKVRAAMKAHCDATDSVNLAEQTLHDCKVEDGKTEARAVTAIKATGKEEVIYAGLRWHVTEEGRLARTKFDGMIL